MEFELFLNWRNLSQNQYHDMLNHKQSKLKYILSICSFVLMFSPSYIYSQYQHHETGENYSSDIHEWAMAERHSVPRQKSDHLL